MLLLKKFQLENSSIFFWIKDENWLTLSIYEDKVTGLFMPTGLYFKLNSHPIFLQHFPWLKEAQCGLIHQSGALNLVLTERPIGAQDVFAHTDQITEFFLMTKVLVL